MKTADDFMIVSVVETVVVAVVCVVVDAATETPVGVTVAASEIPAVVCRAGIEAGNGIADVTFAGDNEI